MKIPETAIEPQNDIFLPIPPAVRKFQPIPIFPQLLTDPLRFSTIAIWQRHQEPASSLTTGDNTAASKTGRITVFPHTSNFP